MNDHENFCKKLGNEFYTRHDYTDEDREVRAYITTEDKTGLWDVLEYRNGLTIAANLISTKMIKDTEEYKSIPQDIVDNFYTTIEYLLASFANDGLSSNGYPSSIGKYNLNTLITFLLFI